MPGGVVVASLTLNQVAQVRCLPWQPNESVPNEIDGLWTVAQLAEQLPVKEKRAGSMPAGPANFRVRSSTVEPPTFNRGDVDSTSTAPTT